MKMVVVSTGKSVGVLTSTISQKIEIANITALSVLSDNIEYTEFW